MMIIDLPYPPTVNTYWRQHQGRTLISRKGRAYRGQVKLAVLDQIGRPEPLQGRLRMKITAFMPDKRRRDLDNLCKGILDCLQHAGVYRDDQQIDDLRLIRGPVSPPGKVTVELRDIELRRDPDTGAWRPLAKPGERTR